MKNALACFLKYPEPGKVKTRLAAELSEEMAADFYEAMAERVITELYPLNQSYDVFLYIDGFRPTQDYQSWLGDAWQFRIQIGDDLGERMSRVVTELIDEGYDQVILIGSDCIGLDETFLNEAFQSLENVDVIVGPSKDGGYYLLGLQEKDLWLFENMPWSTEDVLEYTLQRIEHRNLELMKLEEKIDVDTLDDLKLFRKELPDEHFLARKVDQMVLERLGGKEEIELNDDFNTHVFDFSIQDVGSGDEAES